MNAIPLLSFSGHAIFVRRHGEISVLTIRGILFDKDGTLIDFDRTWVPAYSTALDDLCNGSGDAGLKLRCLVATGYDEVTGGTVPNSPMAAAGNDEIAAMWLEVAKRPRTEQAITRLVQVMENHAATHPVPLFDLGGLFEQLIGRGLVLGVATMDAEWVARQTLRHLEVEAHIDFCAGYDSGHGRKPGGGMVTAFCAHEKLHPEEVMVVGDNPHDLHMARDAGARLAVGVCSGVGGMEDLLPDADHIIEDATGIVRLLD